MIYMLLKFYYTKIKKNIFIKIKKRILKSFIKSNKNLKYCGKIKLNLIFYL